MKRRRVLAGLFGSLFAATHVPGAAADTGARSAPGAAVAPSPRPVRRGESTEQRALVDWLNATFDAPPCDLETFIGHFAQLLGRPVAGLSAGGMLGFKERVDLEARVGSRRVIIGCIAFGGEAQRGRWLFQLTGAGCRFVPDWQRMRDMLEQLDARITRLDLAVDCLEGQYTVDDAADWYCIDGFTTQGRRPKSRLSGDWLDRIDGRTFYVGNAANGKLLRVYEKGKEQGDLASEWVRFEVQFGNRDREIPMSALTDRDRFFVGAYPALQQVCDALPRFISTQKTGGEISLAHLLHHMRRAYGKAIDVLMRDGGALSSALVEEVRVIGIPKRVNPSSVEAGVVASDVFRRARSYR